jgi:hypothetical protein
MLLDFVHTMSHHEYMETREAALLDDEDYLAVVDVAKMFGVSVATIRRRIQEGDLFPGATKRPAPGIPVEERWVIPRSEVELVSLREISPRTYYRRSENKLESSDKDEHGSVSSPSPSELIALEARVSAIEQHLLKFLVR